jgi:hypothetical protein
MSSGKIVYSLYGVGLAQIALNSMGLTLDVKTVNCDHCWGAYPSANEWMTPVEQYGLYKDEWLLICDDVADIDLRVVREIVQRLSTVTVVVVAGYHEPRSSRHQP